MLFFDFLYFFSKFSRGVGGPPGGVREVPGGPGGPQNAKHYFLPPPTQKNLKQLLDITASVNESPSRVDL